MTDTRRKAQAMLNDARDAHVNPDDYLVGYTALCRAIEQHEAFKQKVSDAAEVYEEMGCPMAWEGFEQFIIRKPDPLVKVLNEISHEGGFDNFNHYAHRLRAALDAAGFEIREKNDE
jgi:hypothetical protein